MGTVTYIARFGNSSAEFYTVALAWPAQAGPMFSSGWWRILHSQTNLDVALRVTAGREPTVLLLLTADRNLQALVATLVASTPNARINSHTNAGEFDELTDAAMSREHLRTHYEGYHRDGQPLVCDFRALSNMDRKGLTDGVGYQVNLRAHPTGPEQQRRVRKYLPG